MLGVINHADAATSSARILRNLDPIAPALPGTPWRDLLTAAGDAHLVAEAAKSDAQLLTDPPYAGAGAGLSGTALGELAYGARWAAAYLFGEAAWAGLAAALRADLRQWLGLAATFTDDWARMAALAVCAARRGPGRREAQLRPRLRLSPRQESAGRRRLLRRRGAVDIRLHRRHSWRLPHPWRRAE